MPTTKPTVIPNFATDATLTAGPQTGLAARLDLGAGVRAQGIYQDHRFPARGLAWQLGTIGDWLAYFESYRAEMQVVNWPERSSFPSNVASVANDDIAIAWAPTTGGPGFQNGSLFVAVGNDTVPLRSADGVIWNSPGIGGALTNSSLTNPSVVFGLNNNLPVFVCAFRATGGYYDTPDGITWTARTAFGSPVNPVLGWNPTAKVWVFAGDSGVVTTADGTVGITCVARTTPAGWIAGSGGVKRVVWNGSLWVILPKGAYNKVLTSPDGVTWTERTLTATQTWSALAYDPVGNLWMAAGQAGVQNTSPDGITWTNPGGANFGGANDLAVTPGGIWVAPTVGFYGGLNYSRDGGATWTRGPAVGTHIGGSTQGYKRILYADNRLIMGKVNGASLSTGIEFAMSLRTP